MHYTVVRHEDPLHQRIAGVAREARKELLPVVPKMKSPVATARADARRLVVNHLHKLDELVSHLLGQTKVTYHTQADEPLKLLELF
ncbi:MAG: hypothetical protein HY300_20080 [Verrucomicrobia bacterium]|nr:hypothetical protein [Verrucomicrobiota bacterium]